MSPEWQARLAEMVRGFHADMAGETPKVTKFDPCVPARHTSLTICKAIRRALDEAGRPLTLPEIVDLTGPYYNYGSVSAALSAHFADYRIPMRRGRAYWAYVATRAAS